MDPKDAARFMANDMAFPVLDRTQTPNETTQLGLTKREYFALHITAGLAGNGIPGSHNQPKNLAADGLAIADELLARLSLG